MKFKKHQVETLKRKGLWEGFLDRLKKDKKNINENIMCVLTEGPGAMFLEQITPEEMNGYIWEYYS